MGCHFLLQGIFPTQGSNLGLPHCRQTLYRLSRQGGQDYPLDGELQKGRDGSGTREHSTFKEKRREKKIKRKEGKTGRKVGGKEESKEGLKK